MPGPAARELERLGERWRTLPFAQALRCAGRLRDLAQALADRLAAQAGSPRAVVRDLGPAAALDQLTVLVYDCAAAGHGEGLAAQLRALRRSLP